MKIIDLVLFAEHSQKLPVKLLSPDTSIKKIDTGKILASHSIDFFLVLTVTSTVTTLFAHSVHLILVTQGLHLAFSKVDLTKLTGSTLPLMLFGYFYFCYFMNHGQTYGMILTKNRIKMNNRNLGHVLRWATDSFLLCFSAGLSFFINKNKWLNFRQDDYLYKDLLTYKDEMQIDLLSRTLEDSIHQETPTKEWKKAA